MTLIPDKDAKIKNFLVESLKQQQNDLIYTINANHPYPCGICQKNVNNNQKAIECTNCKFWVHINCNGTSRDEYNDIIIKNTLLNKTEINEDGWLCNKCV